MIADHMIDDYLDELLSRLRGAPGDVRRTLQETQAHLDDAVAAGISDGLSRSDAERRAVEQFGPARAFARECNRSAAGAGNPLRLLVQQLVALAIVGMISIGISGLVAYVMIAAAGKTFVFGAAPGRTYGASDCTHWLAVQPQAHTCAQAALAESVGDGLLQRLAVGVLGLIVLTGFWAARRRIGTGLRQSLTSPFAALVGTGAFGSAAGFLIGLAIDSARTQSGRGAGQWLSGGIVALVAAAIFGIVLFNRIRDYPAVLRAPMVTVD
jgi:hypothetical protein